MSLRNKYSISNWVLSRECVNKGDLIAFYSEEEQKEIHAIVLGFPSEEHREYLSCRRVGSSYTEVINFYSNIVYKIMDAEDERICSCGAKHTSNPKYHLPYCDLAT